MVSGIKVLNQYSKELFVLLLLAVYSTTSVLNAINLLLLTAKYSNIFLLAIGFNSYRKRISIVLPTG
jgi:hypothetical protein